tara:strand:+ start:289 stop:462 length:174 start_codon:yes stop_codon:yes gene_type:complete
MQAENSTSPRFTPGAQSGGGRTFVHEDDDDAADDALCARRRRRRRPNVERGSEAMMS